MYYAHSTEDPTRADWQPLENHLRNVASQAKAYAASFGGQSWAFAAGMLHDLGKYSAAFQKRLSGGKAVDHSSAGARKAVELFGDQAGLLLAYAIAGHHGGLLDYTSAEHASLEKRLDKDDLPPYQDYPSSLFEGLGLDRPSLNPDARLGFCMSFYLRMVFSCLVDADFMDTERFMDPEKAAWREGRPDVETLWRRLAGFLPELRQKAGDSALNARRTHILDACLEKAENQPGLFSLTVPTGGGKTYSSLAFALKHAALHGMRRVIYIIPYTSIIEQNAEVIRRVLGEDALLEHHSSLSQPSPGEGDQDPARRRNHLASENWDAPVVVSTNVQFFESLFSNRPGKCRKLHNLAGSVIILDEAQMLPRECLKPCLAALKELVNNYSSSVVLCTATQPALGDVETFDSLALRPEEIAPRPRELYEEFRRTRALNLGVLEDTELAGRLTGQRQVLCIVNTRRHARALYLRLKDNCNEGGLYHLSALMHPVHRSRVLAKIKSDLAAGSPCRVVSTQLVEAGVDLDFPVVYRALAGIDSIVQAAGRCNREGRLEYGLVHIFQPAEVRPFGSLKAPAQKAAEVLRIHGGDPMAPEAVHMFFEHLFHDEKAKLDSGAILPELEKGFRLGRFQFAKVAGEFSYFDSPGEAVFICPDEKLRALVLDGLEYAPNPGRYLRMAQPYTVQLYPAELEAAIRRGVISRHGKAGLAVLDDLQAYDQELGLVLGEDTPLRPEEIIF